MSQNRKKRVRLNVLWIMCMAVPFLLSGTVASGTRQKAATSWFLIEEGSNLYLAGTSNVNKFVCNCEDRYEKQPVDYSRAPGYLRFSKVQLQMRTDHFNCRNRKIDADLQKALRADDYPHIRVAFLEAGMEPGCLDKKCDDWFPVRINTEVTITNVTKKIFMEAEAKMGGDQRIELRGRKALYMSDFGISPPEAMFGMIKVNDLIYFHFDLKIQLLSQ